MYTDEFLQNYISPSHQHNHMHIHRIYFHLVGQQPEIKVSLYKTHRFIWVI